VKCGISEERLILLGMGVDAAECTCGNRDQVRRSWETEAGEVVIGHLANHSAEKGTVDLLRAISRLWQRGRRVRLVLAGPEMANFRRFWEGFEISGPVIRLGVLDEQQKRDFFAGLDMFALPSRSDSFGLVLLEAWANRLPNVAYAAGGVAEVIRHELDGLLAPCGDVGALTEALDRLIVDPRQRSQLGDNGWKRTVTEFSWAPRLSRVHDVYRSVVRQSEDVVPSRSLAIANR
jgi:glycosyltransferase involved in cell wall biosynthesis